MIQAVPFKKICQPFQLSVGKNKTVTSSFHWKVECCEWSLCGEVKFIVQGWVNKVDTTVHSCENLSSCWVFMVVDRDRITINLQQDILYYAVYWNAAPLNWWNCLKIILRLTVRMTCVAPWKLIRSHAVAPCWLDDDKECIRSGWRKQCDSPQHTKVWKLHFSKIIWRLALGFSMHLWSNATGKSINLSVCLVFDLEAGRFEFLGENLLGAGVLENELSTLVSSYNM